MSDDWLLRNAESFTPPEEQTIVISLDGRAIVVIKGEGTVHFSDELEPEEAAERAWEIFLNYVAQYNANITEYLQWKNSEHSSH